VSEPIHVAVAVLRNPRGQVLVSRRLPGSHMAGSWEFPGGKVEPGEDVRAALRRELREELGVRVERAMRLIRIRHDYPDRSVLLDVWEVAAFRGRPAGLEGQPLAWVGTDELPARGLIGADRPIIAAVRLPRTCLITPPEPGDPRVFLARLARALENGVRLVQLRLPGMPDEALESLASQVLRLARESGARVLLNGDPAQAARLGFDGVHLGASRLRALDARPPDLAWLGASCHDAAELELAEALGADFALVSPVRPTPSHPEAKPLGWAGLEALCEQATLPVYALGGMTAADVPRAREAGAQGVAGIRGWV